jgi:hypothetical protein
MQPSEIRKSMAKFAILYLGLMAALAGCALFELPASPGDLLFQDDFSRPSSGWDRDRNQAYRSDYVDGFYRIEILQADTTAWTNPGLTFADVRIEVDAGKSAGPDDNAYGVICRYQDPGNYYFFLISSDGFAGIGARRGGTAALLTGEAMLPSEPIILGTGPNHIRADCVGNRLSLFINGVAAAEAEAADWAEGDVGLIATSYDAPGAVLDFDNFSVVYP